MIIITDLLIIDHLISVSVTLLYLPFIFRHLNSIPYFIWNLNKFNLLPTIVSKITGWVANSVDPDEICGISSGSTLFAQANLAEYIL